MKRYLFGTMLLLLLYSFCSAQKAPYNVVIDVTSKDSLVHQMVIKWVNEIKTADPNANVEVVLYGKSLDMITQGKSSVSAEVMRESGLKNMAFKVCSVAMKNNGVQPTELIPGVQTVPDGIYEIISRQHDGWGYIKAAR